MTAMMVRKSHRVRLVCPEQSSRQDGCCNIDIILYKGIFKVGEDRKGTRALPVSGQATILACFHADALSYVPLKH